jgi:hypothetical protein
MHPSVARYLPFPWLAALRNCLASGLVLAEYCHGGQEKRKRCDRRPETNLVESLCRTGLIRGAHQTLYLSYKSLQQGRLIVLPPDQINRNWDVQVGNWQQFDPARALPSCGLADKRHPESAGHQAKGSRMIDGVLNDARRNQTASNACLHDSLVEEGIRRPMKPNKRRIAEVAQPKPLQSGY